MDTFDWSQGVSNTQVPLYVQMTALLEHLDYLHSNYFGKLYLHACQASKLQHYFCPQINSPIPMLTKTNRIFDALEDHQVPLCTIVLNCWHL